MARKVIDIIYNLVRKRKTLTESGPGSKVISLPDDDSIKRGMEDVFKRLRDGGFNVVSADKAIRTEADLARILEEINQAEIAAIKRRQDASEGLETVMYKLDKGIPLNPGDQAKIEGAGMKTTLDAFQGFKPKVIQGGKKEGIEQLLESGDVKKGVAPKTTKETIERKSMIDPKLTEEENIKNMMKENKAAAKRLEEKMKDPDKKAMGGRIGFEKGGMTRRTFLKLLGGLASIPLVGKFFKPAAKVAKTAEVAKQSGVPAYFPKLVEKIKLLGDDVTRTNAISERQIVTKYKDYEMTENLSTGNIEIEKTNEGMGTFVNMAGDVEQYDGIASKEIIQYSPPETIIGKNNKPVKVPAQYEETTARSTGFEGKLEDYDDGLESIDEILEEVGESKIKKSGGGLAYMMGE